MLSALDISGDNIRIVPTGLSFPDSALVSTSQGHTTGAESANATISTGVPTVQGGKASTAHQGTQAPVTLGISTTDPSFTAQAGGATGMSYGNLFGGPIPQ